MLGNAPTKANPTTTCTLLTVEISSANFARSRTKLALIIEPFPNELLLSEKEKKEGREDAYCFSELRSLAIYVGYVPCVPIRLC
jgi:hypothetical protein